MDREMTLLDRSFDERRLPGVATAVREAAAQPWIVAAIDDVLRSMSACDRSMSSSQAIDLFLELRFEVTLRDALERHLMSAG
jgi:hypothetical protein